MEFVFCYEDGDETVVLVGDCFDFEWRRSAMLPRASSEARKGGKKEGKEEGKEERNRTNCLKKRIFVFSPSSNP